MRSTTAIGNRVAVGLSGGGRTLANLLAYQKGVQARGPGPHYDIVAVFASNPDCGGVRVAREAGLPVFIGDFRPTLAAMAAEALYRWLDEQAVTWIALAGFLKHLPLAPAFAERTVNIHPALLPRHGGHGMYGLHVHRSVLAAGDTQSGATLHFVNSEYDQGRIIAQMTVPVLRSDDVESLAARVFAAECQLYPRVLQQLVAGTLPRADGQVERLTYAPP